MTITIAALAGCRPMSTAQYTGPVNPLDRGTMLAQTEPMVVRGQNIYGQRGVWQDYNPQQTPQNLWPSSATSHAGQSVQGQTQVQAQGQFQAGTAPPQNQPQYQQTPNGNVGGGIPVYGNPPEMNFTPDSVVTYQSGQFGQPLPPPGAVLGGPNDLPEADIDVFLEETETGRFMFGVGVNSDAGVSGQIVIDERNFDLWRPPQRFGEILDGTAFRGAGQGLRIEAVPGDQVQRYVVNFTQPYLFDTNVSFNVSGFYYDRRFQDWDEERIGGRMGLGYRLTPDLSVNTSLRAEKIDILNPRLPVPSLVAAVGSHDLYSAGVSVTYDTRDVPFNPTEGHMFEISYEQAFGSFNYGKVEADYRRYFLVAERPDGSGRHVLAFQFRGGITGSDTPLFENFYAGGFSTLRGFDFRGANPVEGGPGGVSVGGEFMFLGTVEYRFPLTADDMLQGVAFVDYGTVEAKPNDIRSENFRVAPGFGLRIAIPAMGPAPIALDFAFPVASAALDREEIFSFFVGFGR